jgi:hypothetical protein
MVGGRLAAERTGCAQASDRYCQLNSRRNSDKMNPPFVMWLINDRLDVNRLFPGNAWQPRVPDPELGGAERQCEASPE